MNKNPREDYKGQASDNLSKILKSQKERGFINMQVSKPAHKYISNLTIKKGYRGNWVLIDKLIEMVRKYKWERELK